MFTPLLILLILVFPLFVAYSYSSFNGYPINIKKYSCWGLGFNFLFFSLGHFVLTDGMIEMLPMWVPLKTLVIYFTGLIELFVGLMFFIARFQTFAAKLGILIFIIFFPANVYAAINGIGLGGHQWGPIYLLIRAPLQVLLIAWAYFLCLKDIKFNNINLSD